MIEPENIWGLKARPVLLSAHPVNLPKAYIVVHYLTDLRDKSFARSDPFLRAVSELLPLITADSKIDTEHGGILRLHDIRLTAKSLSSVIETILRNGYKFVPLSYFMMSTYAFPSVLSGSRSSQSFSFREKRSLYTSYRCERDNHLLLDRMCEQLQLNYDPSKDWQPIFTPKSTMQEPNEANQDSANDLARTEYLYELLKEQLKREIAAREDKQTKIETELGQVWNTTLSRIKKTYSQLGE